MLDTQQRMYHEELVGTAHTISVARRPFSTLTQRVEVGDFLPAYGGVVTEVSGNYVLHFRLVSPNGARLADLELHYDVQITVR